MKKYSTFPRIAIFFLSLVITASIAIKATGLSQPSGRGEMAPSASTPRLCHDFGKLPIYFIPNQGEFSDEALYYARTSGYVLWITKDGLVFDSSWRKEADPDETKDSLPVKNLKAGMTEANEIRDIMRLTFLKANKNPHVTAEGLTSHRVNYFIGADPAQWQRDIPTYFAVLYQDVYPNIDLKIYGTERKVEYDWIIRPGGEVEDILMAYQNTGKTEIVDGNLIVSTETWKQTHRRPIGYQVIDGRKVEVSVGYRKIQQDCYGFIAEEYDKAHPLIIDPIIIVYSTFVGGSLGDYGNSVDVDFNSSAYVVGSTASLDFPVFSALRPRHSGGDYDAFILKFSPDGSALIYSTYFGGKGIDYGNDIDVNELYEAYITGSTGSVDFPVRNAYDRTFNGGEFDVFVAKFNPAGNLIFSTYLGGTYNDYGNSLAVYDCAAVYVTGATASPDYPLEEPYDPTYNGGEYDAYVTKLTSSGNMVFSTFLGGTGIEHGLAIAVDYSDYPYVTGTTGSSDFPTWNPFDSTYNGGSYDAFVTKMTPLGDELVYSTFLGGSGDIDEGNGIALDVVNSAYVTGTTNSPDFPLFLPYDSTLNGATDIFVTKFIPEGPGILYSTYLGGGDMDLGRSIAVEFFSGIACLAGQTWSPDFPMVSAFDPVFNSPGFSIMTGERKPPHPSMQGAFDPAYMRTAFSGTSRKTKSSESLMENTNNHDSSGFPDGWAAVFGPTGSDVILSTYLGGSSGDQANGIAVDYLGAVYVAGTTESFDFPVENAFDPTYTGLGDAFVIVFRNLAVVYPPANFELERVENNLVFFKEYINKLTWALRPYNPTQVVKHRLYRKAKEAPDSSFRLIAELDVTVFTYHDRGLREDELYTYRITSINEFGDESEPAEVSN